METSEGRVEPLIDTSHLRPGPLARGLGFATAAIGVGLGGMLVCWGVSLFWPRPPTVGAAPTAVRDSALESVTALRSPDAGAATRNRETPSGEIIKREVTVFQSVKHGSGEVVTGWTYKDGSGASAPAQQYCYYVVPTGEHASNKIDIAANGNRLPEIDTSLVPNLDAALNQCQWWREGT